MGERFRHRIRVRYSECDPQGHVFNANYLAYFDLALTELWRELGGYEPMVDDGIDMVVAEARLRYLAPLRFDDEVDLTIGPIALGTTSMTSTLTIDRGAEIAAEGELRHVFVDLERSAKAPIPEAVRSGLARYG